jgi:hypothetical protein
MKPVIAVLNIGGRSIGDQSRISFEEAARRWHADFVEIANPLDHGSHAFWQKMLVHRAFQPNVRVLQLDADMLIREDAPSPFPLVPRQCLGVVRCSPSPAPLVGARQRAIDFWSNRTGLGTIDVFTDYVNSGFMLYQPAVHATLFDTIYRHGESVQYSHRFMPEQTILSLLIRQNRIPVCWLPVAYHTCGVERNPAAGVGGRMRTFIYHFCGRGKWALGQTEWRESGPESTSLHPILARLPSRRLLGVQVGATRGQLAAQLLAHRPRLRLLVVGRWQSRRSFAAHDRKAQESQLKRNRDYEAAFRETEFAASRRRLISAAPIAAARAVGDKSLDFVFVGNTRNGSTVGRYVNTWQSKVKPGGFICGWGSRVVGNRLRGAVDTMARDCAHLVEQDANCWFVKIS